MTAESQAWKPKTGLLLVNLGSPEEPQVPQVRSYLREFLSDPRVIDISPPARWLLLNGAILPFRPRNSAKAYQEIWREEGSPLVLNTQDLTAAVRARLPHLEVEMAMRYGKPALADTMNELRNRGCDRLIVFPLYPQYASSSTGTVAELIYREAASSWNTPYVSVIPPFYDHPAFISAELAVSRPVLEEFKPDHILFSFHGLPERHLKKSAPQNSPCLAHEQCCDALTANNRNCYRAQCFVTARVLAQRLELDPGEWSVAFQSRLGRDPWIKPYTDESLVSLAKAGRKRLAVFSPSFVADCLETLEEIGMRADEDFRQAGGEALQLIPSLNNHPAWVDAVVQIVRDNATI